MVKIHRSSFLSELSRCGTYSLEHEAVQTITELFESSGTDVQHLGCYDWSDGLSVFGSSVGFVASSYRCCPAPISRCVRSEAPCFPTLSGRDPGDDCSESSSTAARSGPVLGGTQRAAQRDTGNGVVTARATRLPESHHRLCTRSSSRARCFSEVQLEGRCRRLLVARYGNKMAGTCRVDG